MNGGRTLCSLRKTVILDKSYQVLKNAKKCGDGTHLVGSVCSDRARLILFVCEFCRVVACFNLSLGLFCQNRVQSSWTSDVILFDLF